MTNRMLEFPSTKTINLSPELDSYGSIYVNKYKNLTNVEPPIPGSTVFFKVICKVAHSCKNVLEIVVAIQLESNCSTCRVSISVIIINDPDKFKHSVY